MTTIRHLHREPDTARGFELFARLGSFARRAAGGAMWGRRRDHDRYALTVMNERTLRDIGLTRAHGAQGRERLLRAPRDV